MRGLPDIHDGFGTPSSTLIHSLVAQARFGRADLALDQLETLLPALENGPDTDALMHSLYLRALTLRVLEAPTDEALAACDLLEQAAQQRRTHGWTATAWAMRARIRVDAGAVGEATAALAQAHDRLEPEHLDGDGGFALLDTLAETYHRLRLHDRAEETRRRLDTTMADRSVTQRATHWTGWSYELCARAIEPLAGGEAEPDQRLLDQAVEQALRVQGLPAADLPSQLLRGVAGVRAVAAVFRGHSAEAFALLGEDAFRVPRDLSPVATRLVTLAAMRAHAQVGSLATARNIDDAAAGTPDRVPHLVLEVVRARERLWLESYAGGDVVPVLDRMTKLLVRLGWSGMDLVADTARQALEHQALRAESRTDALTGVGNRRSMDEELHQLLRFSPLPTALVLVDIDDFKEINDRFSHVVGDQVLRRVAACLVKQLRSTDRLLRYGGDEFVALLPNTGDEEANRVAARMSAAVAERSWNELADGLSVTTTTGCAAAWTLTGRKPDVDAERLFLRADEQLLQAKRRRRERAGGGAPSGAERAPAETELSSEVLSGDVLSGDPLPLDLLGRDVVRGEVVHGGPRPEPEPVERAIAAPAGHPEPSDQAAAYEPPAYQQPTYELSTYEQRTYEQRTYEQPTYEQPTYEPSTYEPSTYEPSTYEQQTYEPSTYEQQTYEPPAYEQPAAERDEGWSGSRRQRRQALPPPAYEEAPPTSSIPVPTVTGLPAVIDLAQHDRPQARRADGRHRDVLEVHVDHRPDTEAEWGQSPMPSTWAEQEPAPRRYRPRHQPSIEQAWADDEQPPRQPSRPSHPSHHPDPPSHGHLPDGADGANGGYPTYQEQYAYTESGSDPYDWPKGDPLTDPWVDRG